jgi:hypothetical protein
VNRPLECPCEADVVVVVAGCVRERKVIQMLVVVGATWPGVSRADVLEDQRGLLGTVRR